MGRLIDACVAQKIADSDCTKEDAGTVQYVLSHTPTIEAEPVRHGHWDADADGYADGEFVYDHWFCSECGWDDSGFLEEKPNYKYCPYCGARMEDDE